MERLRQLFRGKKVSEEWRTVNALQPVKGKHCSNAIRTTKYTPLSFLPKNLFYQYQRVTTIFFTIIAILQFLPFSPYKPTWFISVLIIVGLDMLKEIIDDFKRYQSDKELNNSPTHVVQPDGTLKVMPWKSLLPGDVVVLSNQHPIPADGVVLATSNGEAAQCFVDTANLDGETALKPKEAPDPTHKVLFSNTSPQRVTQAGVDFLRRVVVEAEPPSRNLYEWVGRLTWPVSDRGQPVVLSASNLALRGSTVRATSWALVLIMYTGDETRVMLSAPKPVVKRTMMERRMNFYVPLMFLLLAVLCVIGSIVGTIYLVQVLEPSWWFYSRYKPAIFWLINALVFLILLAAFIPLSLEVSKIFTKLGHKVAIDRDVTMWHKDPDDGADIPVVAHTASLSEELGQVDYVFTDKTGTLTSNVMELLKIAIVDAGCNAAVPYGQGVTEIARILAAEHGQILEEPPIPPEIFIERGNRFFDARVSSGAWRQQSNAAFFDRFWLALSLCHTIIVQTEEGADVHALCPATLACHGPPRFNVELGGPDNDPSLWPMPYEAESPDELALVIGAKAQGYVFAGRLTREMVVYVHGERRVYRVEKVNDFTSSRKRSSVVVQDMATGQYHMFTKGADSVMLPRLAPGQDAFVSSIRAINDGYSEEALRGLLIAERSIDADTLHDWLARWDTAMMRPDIEAKNAELSELENELEVGLTLLGMTAVEDKLQDGVPLAIARLLQANIQVWMLTGDKVQTAINIGKACNLITPDMHLEVIEMSDALLKSKEAGDLAPCVAFVKDAIEAATRTISDGCCDRNADGGGGAVGAGGRRHNAAVVMDGACLEFALEREWMPGMGKKVGEFLQLAMMCRSVLCCRLDPKQKGEVVRLVKEKMKAVTLAIGDGANDVNMITQAHVGVGISGKEGRQAVLASDYSFGQFRYVTWLLMVHGRLDYMRLARLILYHFQKNVAWIVPNFFFAFFNAFSGRKFITDMYAFMWNVAWTSLPIIFLTLLDKDIKLHELCPLAFPQLYHRGQCNKDFTVVRFLLANLEGLWMGCVAFFVSFFFVYDGSTQGREVPTWTRGMVANSILVFVANIRILFWMQSWDPVTLVLIGGTLVAYCLVGLALYAIIMPDWTMFIGGEGGDAMLFFDSITSIYVWVAFVVGIILALLPIMAWRFIHRAFSPSLAQVINARTHQEAAAFRAANGRKPTRRELINIMRAVADEDADGDAGAREAGPFGTVQVGDGGAIDRISRGGGVLRGVDSAFTPDGPQPWYLAANGPRGLNTNLYMGAAAGAEGCSGYASGRSHSGWGGGTARGPPQSAARAVPSAYHEDPSYLADRVPVVGMPALGGGSGYNNSHVGAVRHDYYAGGGGASPRAYNANAPPHPHHDPAYYGSGAHAGGPSPGDYWARAEPEGNGRLTPHLGAARSGGGGASPPGAMGQQWGAAASPSVGPYAGGP